MDPRKLLPVIAVVVIAGVLLYVTYRALGGW